MARNEEKANAMLNKWLAIKQGMEEGPKPKRPFIATECEDLGDAEYWRTDVIREVTRKVAQIQNAGLGEHRIRDLNDEINKLLREKHHWERRIVELGGTNYSRSSQRVVDADGKELPNSGGYRYFGAAKELPGVRELFAEETEQSKKRSRGDILRTITPDYFGWRDEDDGVLVREEAKAESTLRAEAVTEWHAEQRLRKRQRTSESRTTAAAETTPTVAAAAATSGSSSKAHVELPDPQDIRRAITERKKRVFLEKYVSPQLRQQVRHEIDTPKEGGAATREGTGT